MKSVCSVKKDVFGCACTNADFFLHCCRTRKLFGNACCQDRTNCCSWTVLRYCSCCRKDWSVRRDMGYVHNLWHVILLNKPNPPHLSFPANDRRLWWTKIHTRKYWSLLGRIWSRDFQRARHVLFHQPVVCGWYEEGRRGV